MDALSDPVLLTIFGTVIRGAAVLLLVIAFVPGLILAWLVRRRMR